MLSDAEMPPVRIDLRAVFWDIYMQRCVNKVASHGTAYNNKLHKQPKVPLIDLNYSLNYRFLYNKILCSY